MSLCTSSNYSSDGATCTRPKLYCSTKLNLSSLYLDVHLSINLYRLVYSVTLYNSQLVHTTVAW
uniref:Uncharacterized protein n=1 Tax=Anguilla anguilla TaxID=7936 RepID=A0A0E9PJR9_ANGAN